MDVNQTLRDAFASSRRKCQRTSRAVKRRRRSRSSDSSSGSGSTDSGDAWTPSGLSDGNDNDRFSSVEHKREPRTKQEQSSLGPPPTRPLSRAQLRARSRRQPKPLLPARERSTFTSRGATPTTPPAPSPSASSTDPSPQTALVLRSFSSSDQSPSVHGLLQRFPVHQALLLSPSRPPPMSASSPSSLPLSSTSTTYPASHLLNLPFDLFFWVSSFMHPVDLVRLTTVSQACRSMATDSTVWAPLVQQSWPITCTHSHPWHSVYVGRIKRALAGALFFCTNCDCTKAFLTQARLNTHLTKCKKLPAPPAHTCPQPGCGRSFSFLSMLQTHLSSHSGQRKHRCTFPSCNKSFQTPYALRLHRCVHTGEKRPHPCTVQGCSSSFNTASALRKHQSTHCTSERGKASDLWRCTADSCGRVYASKSALHSHQAKRHGEQSHRWTCEQCGKGFHFKCHLTRHFTSMHAPRA